MVKKLWINMEKYFSSFLNLFKRELTTKAEIVTMYLGSHNM